ncbi:MAG: DUF1588 domain-containing protein [Verrucomicrobia bacterium]|nr:DUF1588 domain-containing protein [Verrucomicrobiota bacterium]
MPDDELLKLAESGKLRGELRSQTDRMLRDRKSEAFFRNFTGQWLQTRDIETVIVDARQVLQREAPPDPDGERRRRRFRELRDRVYETLNEEEKKELDEIRAVFGQRFRQPLRAELTGEIRRAMRLETEKTIERIFREDRSLLEVLDSNYTYLNEALARHYGLTNLGVKGGEMRLVELPEGTPRGGVLTQGSVLAVTSNPTRTSPVKRGVFVLENLLGTPPAPPPPDIPPLEESSRGGSGSPLSLRQTLTLHREQPLCASCHNRMDPLGLAMENFNAMGMWREQERGQALDASGTLITGESFTNVLELKRVLVQGRSPEFFHTVAEKLLTYALGRGVEHTDTATLDLIAGKLKAAGGKPSVLLSEVIDSAPFQRSRATSASTAQPRSASLTPVSLPADLTKPRLSP